MTTIVPTQIYVALPILDEHDWVSSCLESIRNQTYQAFHVFACVNQPNNWWNNDEKKIICKHNANTIEYLNSYQHFPITIIDKSSPGKGWDEKKYGVGWARKTVMDAINSVAQKNDIIISIDADTVFESNYFQSVIDALAKQPKAVALSNPYYHQLTGNDLLNRAMLHYEIYMRYYLINLFRIQSPYNYTALGSAMAFPIKTYRSIKGITPKKSGEDFYFLQKIRKHGPILLWNNEKVYPATRLSDRVFFGTGPALIKGCNGEWDSYPIFDHHHFDQIKGTYDKFPELFKKDIQTEMDDFLYQTFKTTLIWEPLRKNYPSQQQFVQACHHKIDGLRILQYLKTMHKKDNISDEERFINFLVTFYKNELHKLSINLTSFSFKHTSVKELNIIRNFLMHKEDELRKSS